MNKEIDDKTRAQVLREEAEELCSDVATDAQERRQIIGKKDLATAAYLLRSRADSIDPPRPQIEPGPVRFRPSGVLDWMTGLLTSDVHGEIVDTTSEVWNPEECEITPLRTLGPTQVAVDIDSPSDWPANAVAIRTVMRYVDENSFIESEQTVHQINRRRARRMHEEAEHGSQ